MSYTNVTSGLLKFQLHTYLKENLDLIIKHNLNDWDFKMLYSGDGMTRTGKSTKACQDACYCDPTFAPNWQERVIFDGKKLKETAYKIGKNKALVYDEAREGLDSKKQMERYTKNLLDFFSQCGNLNQMIFIVLPEYFELPKTVAITQSIYLINCYARKGFDRGYFDFFNRIDKKYLYIKGTKYLDYKGQRPTFKGTFTNWLPFDRKEYEALKNKALQEKTQKQIEEEAEQILLEKETRFANKCLKLLVEAFCTCGKKTYTIQNLAKKLNINRRTIPRRLKRDEE